MPATTSVKGIGLRLRCARILEALDILAVYEQDLAADREKGLGHSPHALHGGALITQTLDQGGLVESGTVRGAEVIPVTPTK